MILLMISGLVNDANFQNNNEYYEVGIGCSHIKHSGTTRPI